MHNQISLSFLCAVYPPCSNGEFRCNDGLCIPMSKHCDLKDDCNDRSDEIGCGKYCSALFQAPNICVAKRPKRGGWTSGGQNPAGLLQIS